MTNLERNDVWVDNELSEPQGTREDNGFPEPNLADLATAYKITASENDPTAPTADRLAAAERILKQGGGEKLSIAGDNDFTPSNPTDTDPNSITPQQAAVAAKIAVNTPEANSKLISADRKLTEVLPGRAMDDLGLVPHNAISKGGANYIPPIKTQTFGQKPLEKPAPKGFFGRLFGGE